MPTTPYASTAGIRWTSYADRRSDHLLFADTTSDGFGGVRVRVRCFGGESETSVAFALGAACCGAGDGGVLGAGDGRQPGEYQAQPTTSSAPRELGGAAFVVLDMEKCSVPVMEYNQGSIKLANNLFSSKKTRHIDTKQFYRREYAWYTLRVNIMLTCSRRR